MSKQFGRNPMQTRTEERTARGENTGKWVRVCKSYQVVSFVLRIHSDVQTHIKNTHTQNEGSHKRFIPFTVPTNEIFPPTFECFYETEL